MVALLTTVLSASTARAEGCADRHEAKPSAVSLNLSLLTGLEDPDTSPFLPSCTGPRCTSRDSVPTSPPVSGPSFRSERWGVLTIPLSSPEPRASLPGYDEAGLRPTHAAPFLFRPPRIF